MMMMRITTLTYFLTFILLFAQGTVRGQQEPGGLFLSGKITTEQGNVGGTVIKLFRNGKPMVDYQVDNSGRFDLRFEFNFEYVLIFMRSDNFPQKYAVSTIVPTEVLRRDRKFPPFPLDVNLFTEIPRIDRSFSENSVLRIYYSEAVDNFIPEIYYNNAQIKKLIDQAVLQSQTVSREADLLRRLSNAELAALKREYDEILKKAGSDFDKKEYIAALDEYKTASRIFPSEQFPKDRIAEINDLIAILGLQEELDKQQAEKYNRLVREADRLFASAEYNSARDNYEQALYVRPGDLHSTGRVSEIDRIIREQQLKQQYDDIVALGDKAFREKLWDESKKRYQEALGIRAGESYPLGQIAKIDEELQRLSQLADRQSTFDAAVLNGDAAYSRQFYPKALEYYRTALTIKPDDQSVVAKIQRVEREQKEINDKLFYDETIANADKAFKNKEYEGARSLYSTALTAMPGQVYPQRQIEAIDKIFESNKEYESLVARGDAGIATGDYGNAREDFRNALNIRPKESYPTQKIREIDAILANLAKEDQQYRQLIATADRYFNALQFPQAKAEFQKAAAMKSDDPYPPEMLGKIVAIEAEQVRLEQERLLAEQNRLNAEQQERDLKYQSIVREADRLAESNELVGAVSKFRDALEVKPQESYPLQRIEEIRGIITRQAESRKSYDTAIAQADRAFQQQRYAEARTAYQQAQQTLPGEVYPGEQLAKIDSVEAEQARLLAERQAAEEAARLAAMAEQDRQYAQAISAADGLFEGQQYVQAIAEYRKALQVKPGESYPTGRIAEADRLNTAMVGARKSYDTAIAQADRAFQQQRYAEARTAYQQAQQALPGEVYPGEQLAKIDSVEAEQARLLAERQAAEEAARLAAMAEQDRQYAQAISAADGLFDGQQYVQAIAEYRKALQVKPGENYPTGRIAEADRLNTAMVGARKSYDTAIAQADRAFQQQRYAEARTAYQQARQALPGEVYPGEQLAKIDSVEAEQARLLAERQAAEEAARLAAMAEQDRQYAQAISAADGLFEGQQYVQAIAEYRKALQVKPGESYPTGRIAEADRLNTAMVGARKSYDTAIAQADRAFQQQRYAEARTAYQQARQALPGEGYPGEQLAKIDSVEAEQARLLAERQAAEEATRLAAMAEQDRQYAQAISAADGLFEGQQYVQAIAEYRKALQVKPGESYPTGRIAEADRLNTAMVGARKSYDTAIAQADRAFQQQRYAEARTAYQQAQQALPGEGYPGEQLAKIDSIEAEQARLLAERQAAEEAARLAAMAEQERQYAQAISAADGLFEGQQYVQAIAEYRKALQVKPGESHPTGRIAEADRLNTAMVGARKSYDTAIAQADRAFQQQRYAEARTAYQQAQQTLPGEVYPGEQLAKIDSVEAEQARLLAERQAAEEAARLAAMAEQERQYAQAISAADGLFDGQQYVQAIAEYRKALQVKPGENYPSVRISESEKLQAEMLESENRNREYARLIAAADRAFSGQNYNSARTGYESALNVKPEESYPRERITEIENIFDQRGKDEKYRQFLLAADGFFRISSWDQARNEYVKALEVKPEEEYPRQQIAKIDETLQRLAQRQVPVQTETVPVAAKVEPIIPATQAASADRLVSDEVEALYQSLIVVADEAFTVQQYNVSRAWYHKALDVKPAESYPAGRITEINGILASMQMSQRDREFQQFINQGDDAFNNDQLAVARGWYNRALTIKPADDHARTQIVEIQQIINSRLQGGADQVYTSYMNEGDKAFETKNYSVARVWYQRARQVKPSETLPAEKLDAIRKALSGQ
jgi:tetratricopeptide (TPR) repeat protein